VRRLARLWRFGTLSLAARMFAGAPGPRLFASDLFGFPIVLDVARASVQRLLFLEGERFVHERHLLARLLAPGMRVADVGANIGYYLLLFEHAVGPGGHITCFEPDPENLRELRATLAVNGFANVEVVAAAVGAADGIAALRTGLNATVVAAGPGTIQVPLVSLDRALAAPIDLLKIDVEGYEAQVLAGARRLLAGQRPALFVEIHPALLAPPATVDSVLAQLAEHYPPPRIFERNPERGFAAKLAARYLDRTVQQVGDVEALLAACRGGRRSEPFWAVYSKPPCAS
jgi:FkbM family methyltransferase